MRIFIVSPVSSEHHQALDDHPMGTEGGITVDSVMEQLGVAGGKSNHVDLK